MTDQEPMWGANLRAEVEYRKAAEAEARRELAEARTELHRQEGELVGKLTVMESRAMKAEAELERLRGEMERVRARLVDAAAKCQDDGSEDAEVAYSGAARLLRHALDAGSSDTTGDAS